MNKSFLKKTQSTLLFINLAFSFSLFASYDSNSEKKDEYNKKTLTICSDPNVNAIVSSIIEKTAPTFKNATNIEDIYKPSTEKLQYELSEEEKTNMQTYLKNQKKDVRKKKLDVENFRISHIICWLAFSLEQSNPERKDDNSTKLENWLKNYHEAAIAQNMSQGIFEKLYSNYCINNQKEEKDANKTYNRAKATTEQEQTIHENLRTALEKEKSLSAKADDIKNKIKDLKGELKKTKTEIHKTDHDAKTLILQNSVCYFLKQNDKKNLIEILEEAQKSLATTKEKELKIKKELLGAEVEPKNKQLISTLKNEIVNIQKEKSTLEYKISDLEQKIRRVELPGTTTGKLLRSWI